VSNPTAQLPMMIMIELLAGEYAWSSIGKQLRQKDW
jgi:hypothetical protein